jgi:hypothetical protein
MECGDVQMNLEEILSGMFLVWLLFSLAMRCRGLY